MAGLRPLIIVGASGFGREVYFQVRDINKAGPTWDVLGFVDDQLEEKTVEGIPVLGPVHILSTMTPKPFVAIAVADPTIRKHLVERITSYGIKFATLIHPSVRMSEFVQIGEGTIIGQNNLFTTNIKIGKHCIINVNCTVGHDTTINDYTSIMSHTAIAGDVTIGPGCYFGLHCTVINKVKIGSWSTFGAGTVIVKDMPDYVTAVGVPARIIKHRDMEAGEGAK
jgi:sugar O-acyltransferase (sialic acid O-acetyltransferase NeuD family)